jgi:hypothetical protein
MANGTNDGRGVQPPRTLFSLGRPGSRAREEEVVADTLIEEPVEAVDEEIQYACGACGALLPTGAAFCGECGTPVAIEGFEEYAEYDEEYPASYGAEQPAGEVSYTESGYAETGYAETGYAETGYAETGYAESGYAEPEAPAGVPADYPTGAVDSDTMVTEASYADAAVESATSETAYPEAETADAWAAGDETLVEEQLVEDPAGEGLHAPTAPAAVLYADPSVVEPLPAPPEGSWGVSEPLVGTAADDTLVTESISDTYAPATPPPTPEVPASLVDTTPPGATLAPAGQVPPKKSNKGVIIGGVAAAVVLILVIAALALSGGSKSKKEDVATGESTTTTATAQGGGEKTTTTKAGESTTTTAGETSTTTATTEPTTVTTLPTTAAPTVAPTTPPPTVAPTTPPPSPGNIVPSIPNGARINIPKGGSTTLTLSNNGGSGAQFILRGTKLVVEPAQGNIPPGGSVMVTIRAAAGAEGDAAVNGTLAGLGNYSISVFILNG